MTIEHKDIPDAQRHEPKGVSTAAANTSYKSDGSGSGTWRKANPVDLNGITVNGSDGDAIVSNGAGGFRLSNMSVYGLMAINNNANNFAVTAASDSTLMTTSDYLLLTGVGAPWTGEHLEGVTFDIDALVVPRTGTYEIALSANISGFPTNTSSIGFKCVKNGETFAPRGCVVKSNSGGDYGVVGSFGYFDLIEGDEIQVYVASTATGNLVIRNAALKVELKKG